MKLKGTSTLCMAILLLASVPLEAQTNRGRIAGSVFDAQDVVIPQPRVQVTYVGTSQAEGRYAVDLLVPVVYRVTVEASGFANAVLENVKVQLRGIQFSATFTF